MLNKIIGALGQVAEAGGTIVGIRHGTEEPSYTVDRKVGDIEIRSYGPRIAAETTVDADEDAARNEGFRRLAGYIFGGNTTKTKIAMTAPVAQQNEKIAMTAPVASERGADGQWVIRFFMPSKYALESLPTPNDDRVRLVTVPPDRVAVLRFAGILSTKAVASRTGELLKFLRDSGIETVGEPMGWFYDPPWTLPFLRRNEVVVSIAAGS
ncbi:MAG: SOUL family heme-binding protein [Mycobacterium sp.]